MFTDISSSIKSVLCALYCVDIAGIACQNRVEITVLLCVLLLLSQ